MVKKCFFCGSPNVIRNGLRGRKKQYKCKDCARQFLGGTRRDKSQVILEYIEDKQTRKQLAAKVCELQEKTSELHKVTNTYYLYTAEGERLFCERHNCRIYPDNRGIYWHFKVTDYPAYILPTEISRAYLDHEISIRDVYVYWRKNGSK